MDELFTLIRQKRAIIFAGSGISLYAGYPSAAKLAEFILENIPPENRKTGVTALSDVAELYCRVFGRDRLIELIRPIFEKNPHSTEYHELISQIPQIRTIITTNYDRIFEIAYNDNIQVILTKKDLVHSDSEKISLLKIHGSIDQPDSILITKSDYDDFFHERKSDDLLWNEVKVLCAKYAVVIIGYSLEDSDIRHILIDILRQIGQDHKGIYLISPNSRDYDIEELTRKFQIKYFNLTAEAFVSQLKEEVENHKVEDYKSGYLTDDEFHEMVGRRGYLCEITIDPKGSKSISISPNQSDGPIPVDFEIKTNDSETRRKIEGILSGKSFEPISLTMSEKEREVTFIAQGIGILPSGAPGSEYTISPKPGYSFKAFIKVKNTGIIFTDLNGETYRSPESFLIKIIHPLFDITFELSAKNSKTINFSLNFEGSHGSIKDFLLYNMLNAWKSGNPLIVGVEGDPSTIEIPSEALQNKSDLLENIDFNYSLLKDLLQIQDFFGCIFWNIYEITDEDYESISLLLRIANGDEIHINSCSGIIDPGESGDLIKQLTEGTDKLLHIEGKRHIQLFGVKIILDFKADIQDAYIDESGKVLSEMEKGTESILILIKSRSNNALAKFEKT